MVHSKVKEVSAEVSNLLGDGAFEDPGKWGRVWQLLDAPARVREAKTLILTLVLQMSA